MFEVNIYIETSLQGPGRRKGWYAAVTECRTKSKKVHIREDFEKEEETTYHRSTLRALIKSLKRLNASCNLTIHTGDMYVITNHDQRLEEWEGNGFLNSRDEPISNREEWKEVSKLLKGHKVLFVWEKNHAYTERIKEKAKYHLGEAAEMV